MEKKTGSFVISLDFELMWGVRDLGIKDTYGHNILGVHTALPRMLTCFKEHKIRATFATVGFLFFHDKNEILENLPQVLPAYKDENLSPYPYLHTDLGENYEDDKFHYGLPLLEMIRQTPGQEIGTHTFSHYYCLEEGQTLDSFKDDLLAAIRIAEKRNIKIKSIIFPRNQVNDEYLKLCREAGITSYRNNELSWLYTARNASEESMTRRAIRISDSYINLSGHHCYTDEYMASSFPYNIASSRFLRPYSERLKKLEPLRLKRITDSMTHAAKNNLTYHLWWHPHNFGINQDQNFAFLEKIFTHYKYLNVKYAFTSRNMSDMADKLNAVNGK